MIFCSFCILGGDFILKSIQLTFLSLFVSIVFLSLFFVPFVNSSISQKDTLENGEILAINPNGFVWPIPGYTKISSPFGKRKSPTAGASSFHYGCDIPAPQGTKLIAVSDGTITFCSFLGAGGYTITLSFANVKVSYCHVDPNFIVQLGDTIKQGQVIGHVGPKNVYGVPGNPYRDDQGNPTNGATTGCHFHCGMRIDGNYVNPLDYFS